MSGLASYSAQPDYAVAPGEHIAEWLDDNGVNAAELARRLGVTPKHISELLSGKAPLSARIAVDLERVTGIPARMWNGFEVKYREELVRLAEKVELEEQYVKAKAFPLAYLRKWGFVTAEQRDKAGTVRGLLTLFGIAHLDSFDATWLHAKVAYRKVPLTNEKTFERATWLAVGEKLANVSALPEFSRDAVIALVPELRILTGGSDPVVAITRAQALLRDAGVAVCLVPPIPGFGVSGATRWIAGRPVIQLSMRGKTDDQMWFTLFHEIGHTLLHGQKSVFMQGMEGKIEDEADSYAARTLIPEEFTDRLPTNRNSAAVRALADELGIAPSIVLGQAQRITGDFAWGHGFRVTLEWSEDDPS